MRGRFVLPRLSPESSGDNAHLHISTIELSTKSTSLYTAAAPAQNDNKSFKMPGVNVRDVEVRSDSRRERSASLIRISGRQIHRRLRSFPEATRQTANPRSDSPLNTRKRCNTHLNPVNGGYQRTCS